MASNEIRKIIEIDTSRAGKSIAELKKENESLRSELSKLEKGTKDYQDTLSQIKSNTDAVDKATRSMESTFKDASKAIGQTENSLGNLKGKTIDIKSSFSAFKSSISEAMMGVASGSMTAAGGVGVLKVALDSLLANPVILLAAAFSSLVVAIKNNERAMAGIRNGMKEMEPLLNVFRNVLGILGETIGKLIGALGKVLQPLLPILTTLLTPLITKLKILGEVFEAVGKVFSTVSRAIESVFYSLVGVIQGAVNAIIDGINYINKPLRSLEMAVEKTFFNITQTIKRSKLGRLLWKEQEDGMKEFSKTLDDYTIKHVDFVSKIKRNTAELSQDITKNIESQIGSYTALSRELQKLRESWENATSEAERATIGAKIQELEGQLHDMEATLKSAPESVQHLIGSYNALQEKLGELTAAFNATNDSSERAVLAEQIKQVRGEMAEITKQLEDVDTSLSENSEETIHAAGSYAALQEELGKLRKAFEETADEAERQKIGKSIQDLQTKIKELDKSREAYSSRFVQALDNINREIKSLPKPLELASKATKTLGNAFKALIANPVGAVIMAIVAAVKLLKMGFEGSESATNKLKVAMSAFEPVINAVKNALGWAADKVGDLLLLISDLVKGVQSAGVKIAEVLNKIGLISDERLDQIRETMEESKRLTDLSQELAEREIALEDRKREFLVAEAKTEMEISELRANAADKEKYTQEERIKMLEEAKNKERALMDERLAIAQEEFDLIRTRNSLSPNTEEDYQREAQAEANLYKVKKDYNDKIRALNAKLTKDTTNNNKTVKEEQDKTLEHEKAVVAERLKLYSAGNPEYYELKKKELELDWQILEKKLKNEKYTDEQIEQFRKSHIKALADLEKTRLEFTLSRDAEILGIKISNAEKDKKLTMELLKRQEDMNWESLQKRLQDENYTSEQIEIYKTQHLKNLEKIETDYTDWLKEEEKKRAAERKKAEEDRRQAQEESLEQLSSNTMAYIMPYYEFLKQKEELEYAEQKLRLEAEGATNEELELLREAHNNRMSELDSQMMGELGEMVNTRVSTITGAAADLFSAMADLYDEGSKESKAFAIASATMSMLGGVVSAVASAFSPTNAWMTIYGQIAMAAATSATVIATGIAQIAKIKSTSKNGGASVSATPMPDVSGAYDGMQYTRSVNTYEEQEQMNAPIWVSVSEIDEKQQRGRVRVAETSF